MRINLNFIVPTVNMVRMVRYALLAAVGVALLFSTSAVSQEITKVEAVRIAPEVTQNSAQNRIETSIALRDMPVESLRREVARHFTQGWVEYPYMVPDMSWEQAVEEASPQWLRHVAQRFSTPDADLLFLIFSRNLLLNPRVDFVEQQKSTLVSKHGYELTRWEYADDSRAGLTVTFFSAALKQELTTTYSIIAENAEQTWGIVTSQNTSTTGRVIQTNVIRITPDSIDLVTPQPEEEDFFASGEFVYPRLDDSSDSLLKPCTMHVTFAVPSNAPPHTIMAELKQSNNSHHSTLYQCIAECSIPYVWANNAFVAQKALCKKEKEWGVRVPVQ